MTDKNDKNDVQALLGAEAHRPWWRRNTIWVAGVVLVLVGAGLFVAQQRAASQAAPRFVTSPVARGTLSITVTATGTLQPTRSVAVGSELSGTVARVFVDVNDRVKKGQVLVELDTAKLRDSVAGSRASLAAAVAQRHQAEATLAEARANLARYEEVARLSGGKVPSAAELDTARATALRAEADLAAAAASVTQVQTALSTNETNLAKASIRSPIDGTVLARTVEPGNAVAASLQAVTLLTLAEDLTKMKLSVDVDEADVGQVHNGQRARFTVAAQPGRYYPARITRVAFGSTKTDNVVTYTTDLEVDNGDLSLRPGMTATATIAATERENVLLVPNSALRFKPNLAGAPGAGGGNDGIMSKLMPRPPGMSGYRRSLGGPGKSADSGKGTIWVLKDGQPVALEVKKGLSDGRQTEVSGPGVAEGLAVITDQASAAP
ncbi:efflux RND transporter periplasmic adaptor subunit [Rubrivivax gelatinosus]|uniref:Efflux transporter periplasmic adaptor subunit n=1 Tax=Rubrivivax gelatinosus TaxID=28068 RepID=A0ABS1E144_RUBGE|nr:efflux RND transporter periplasmic adaptor subunit [Rubrivivax gelatinosus]MBK1714660.1 efflux transporter periplasmic adaptor subunit [Rubrivivax gelatinosus]